MKKIGVLVLANLLLAHQAMAQSGTGQGPVSGSSLTLFGIADILVAYGSGSAAHTIQLASNGNVQSRLGFRGVQDLGGGLGAGFWLETGLQVDTGTGTAGNTNNQPSGATSADFMSFSRRATVSLMDFWGEIRMGRDFTATFRNRDQTDPFGTSGVGASLPYSLSIAGVTSTRASNMVGYFLPGDLGGVFGEVQVFMGENISHVPNAQDGNGYQARIGWSGGPFGIAVATGKTKYAQTATTGDIDVYNIGAFYDFGVVRMTAGYFVDERKQFVSVKSTSYIVGAVIPVGPHQLKVSYSSNGTDEVMDPRAKKVALGYVYNLSKRTAAYGTVAYLRNSGNSAVALNNSITEPGRSSRGVDLGLRHSF
ncbi:porin [Variovorax sp. dw_954]|uniref:porin n=1 Tax=Variovorax sp. dw_954 TaxID=2720078 RepID=UPI001BD475CD|nr:porin [Variovorax sp. dw_954]